MKKKILNRILELGGKFKDGTTLQEYIEGIEFNHPLYPQELWGHELYGIDEFYDKNKGLYREDKNRFYESLISHFFSDHEIPYGQTFYRKRLFTPLTKGTSDYEEWGVDFEDKEMTDLSEIIEVIGNEKLEFMEIAYSYGFPDGYYICLSDPNPENPTIFGTDHEVYFQEITNEGTLEEFLNQFYTKTEFLELVKNYIENEKEDK
ncbi:hypothetical protein [Aquimarina aggregata]|uniref:hypothetical protein n=1 Tax=Aquimarina aggregata TaxID=1642818 RepID=UPI0024928AF9|nr:hypothetical protein [Aquimarina aggregata]